MRHGGRFSGGRFNAARFGGGFETSIAALSAPLLRDPSDLSTLWQDAAGTIPVMAHGDPVGRQDNKGTLGGYFLPPNVAERPKYGTDGTYHWLETDGLDDEMSLNIVVPFSTDVFTAIAFRVISNPVTFPQVLSNRGDATNNTQQRQPLLFLRQSSPTSMGISYGGQTLNIGAGSSMIGQDAILTTSNDPSAATANLNGQTSSGSGVTLTDGSTQPYSLYRGANLRDYGGLHLNRVPSASEQEMIRSYYAGKCGGVA